MIDRNRYFPVDFCVLVLLTISVIVNYSLYQQLLLERESRYWVSGKEYSQIKEEIQKLERNSGVIK
jgi:hypothetical protein